MFLMDKIEVVFGIPVFLFSVLSILSISSSVVPSSQFPGHYTYSADLLPRILLFLLPFVGFAAICHATYKRRLLEFALSIVVVVWGFYALLSISMTLIDGHNPYIRGSITDQLNEMTTLLILGMILGVALMLDGTVDTQKRLKSIKRQTSLHHNQNKQICRNKNIKKEKWSIAECQFQ